MACPFLEYKRQDAENDFDHPRPYCEAMGSFVQPLRGDICNDVGRLSHEIHCEIFLESESSAAE